jgi:integrase
MTLYKRPNSPYYYYDFIFDGQRYARSTRVTNKVAAERIQSVLKANLAQSRVGIVLRKEIPQFSDFAKQFLENVKAERARNTHRSYSTSVRMLTRVFGGKRLDAITPELIRNFKEARLRQKRRNSTVNGDLRCLRRVLSVAVKDGILATSPFFGRRVEFLREEGRERILSFEEERKYFLSASPLLKDIGTIIIEMGHRPGEVFELRKESVHLTTTTPYVHVERGKTKAARRDVPITKRAFPILERRAARAEGDYLFPRRVGNRYNWSQPMTELHPAHTKALRRSGIKPWFRIYDLRHTYGSRAIEAGVDPLSLQKLMGHEDLKTTMRYVHLSRRHLDEAQKKIECFRSKREVAESHGTSERDAYCRENYRECRNKPRRFGAS